MKVVLCQAVLAMLCLTGCGKPNSLSSPPQAVPSRPVTLVPVEPRKLERIITVTGVLAAMEDATLSTKVSGRLQHIHVDIGSAVKKGDVLARVEPRDYELGLKQAQAALAQARAMVGLKPEGNVEALELAQVSIVKSAGAMLDEATKNRDRVRNLFEARIASQSELETVESTYKVAVTRYESAFEEARTRIATVAQRYAEVELAQKRLSDTSLVAPFDGKVQARPASVGEYVAAGTPIVKLVKTDPLRLRLQVPERHSSLVQLGQKVRVLVEADTNAYHGVIARLTPALEDDTRMLLAEADFPAQGALRPGLLARTHIVINPEEPGLTVPSQAIVTFAGIEKVVLVRDGKALEKVVSTGRSGRDWVEIKSGLSGGERVVLQPAGLRTGQPVTIQPEHTAEQPHRNSAPAS